MPSHRVRRAALSATIAFSFVFIFAIVALAQDPRQNAPGAFDFYVLALSWSPSFCESAKERAPNGRPEQGFPSYCQVPAQRLDRTTISAALDLMPSPRLIFRQWVRLIVLAIRRWRVPVGGSAAALAGGGPGCRAQAAAARPLPTVKPRNNFGLRGTPD
jgi:ribonuclease I